MIEKDGQATLSVNTSKTDPLSPAQCDPLKILFQNGVN